MKKTFRKDSPKLKLHRETLLALDQEMLANIGGGLSLNTGCVGASCHTQGPTLCTNLC